MRKLLILSILFLITFRVIFGNDIKTTFNPFSIDIDPMKRLLLMDMKEGEDEIYLSFEPQYFDDDKNGKGLLVIAWRKDGMIDIYHESTINVDPLKYTITGKGLNEIYERDMNNCYFIIDKKGVKLEISFYDFKQRYIELYIKEESQRRRKPFGLLAPVGEGAESPNTLPLVLLRDFYFVRKKGTTSYIKIDGFKKELEVLSMPIDWSKMLFTRYSSNPFVVSFNKNFEGNLLPIDIINKSIIDKNSILNIDNEGNIKSIERSFEDNSIKIIFNPFFPNISNIAKGEVNNGEFEILLHKSIGSIEGEYQVSKVDSNINIILTPSGGWYPKYTKVSLRILYNVVEFFKNWPKSYVWEANISKENNYYMTSKWERINNND